MTGHAIVIQGDARRLPLPDNSVDLLVTSPPYFALRSYTDGGEHYDGQIGSETSPAEWLQVMLECTREWIRVLKPTGSMFVNLGDKYSDRAGPEWAGSSDRLTGRPSKPRRQSSTQMAPRKSLLGLPWRYALGCIDELGLILRAEIVWSKPNGLPESVTDRVRRSHEQWFHFVRNPRYFSAVDEIREPYSGGVIRGTQSSPRCSICGRPPHPDAALISRREKGVRGVESPDLSNQVGPDQGIKQENRSGADQHGAVGDRMPAVPLGVIGDAGDGSQDSNGLFENGVARTVELNTQMRGASVTAVTQRDGSFAVDQSGEPGEFCCCRHPLIVSTPNVNPLGKLPGSVWEVPSEPLSVPAELGVDHFAAFPTAWPKRLILGWSPSGICVECGEGRRPVIAAVGLNMDRPQARRAHALATEAGLTESHFDALLSVGVSDTGRGAATQSGTGKNTPEVYALADEARSVLGGYAREYLLRRPTRFDYRCACAEPTAPTTPAVVLDPFGGTGTTALVAKALGRVGVSVDLSHDYCRIARWRTSDPAQLAKVLELPKPPQQVDDQLAFDFGEVS